MLLCCQWCCYINGRRGGSRKTPHDSTSSDTKVERVRHVASHHEDRRKRMRLVRDKKVNDDVNPMQVYCLLLLCPFAEIDL